MPTRWPSKRRPFLYRRLDAPPAPVKHTLKVGDFVRVVSDYCLYGNEYTWVAELLADGRYIVGSDGVGYTAYERRELQRVPASKTS